MTERFIEWLLATANAYLPSPELLGIYAVGAVAAFSVVQSLKVHRAELARHSREHCRMTALEMRLISAGIAAACTVLASYYLVELPARQALVHGVLSGFVSPAIIAVALAFIDRFAPTLSARLSVSRHRPPPPPGGPDHTRTGMF